MCETRFRRFKLERPPPFPALIILFFAVSQFSVMSCPNLQGCKGKKQNKYKINKYGYPEYFSYVDIVIFEYTAIQK